MDETEIDEWYEIEKKKAEDNFLKDLQEKKDHKQAEERYSKKLKELMKVYNQKMERNIRMGEINDKIKKIVKEKLGFLKKKK